MASIQNPYIVGASVKGQALYGRDKIIAEIEGRLPYERLLILYGPRCIGKTSILQDLCLTRRLSRFTFIYVDSVQIATKSAAEAAHYIASEIARALKLRVPNQSAFEDRNFFQRHFLPRVYQTLYPKHLVLILDEFDTLGRLKEETPRRRASSVELITELVATESQLAFVIGLGRKSGELLGLLQHYLRDDSWIRVSYLELEAARSLIINTAADRLIYEREAVDHIIALTSGHPYFTQVICFEVFDQVGRGGRGPVNVEDVEAAAALILEGGKTEFGRLWEDLTPAERLAMALYAEASDKNGLIKSQQFDKICAEHRIQCEGPELRDAVNGLIELEIIRRETSHDLRFGVELVRRWVASEHPVAAEHQAYEALLSNRAITEYKRGQAAVNLDVAIEHYRAALEASPNHLEAHLALGAALLEQGRVNEALKTYESASGLDEVKAREGLEQARLAQKQARKKVGLSRNVIKIAAGIGILVIACLLVGLWIPIQGQPLLAGILSPTTPTREPVSQPVPTSTPTLKAPDLISAPDTPTATMTPVLPTNTPVLTLTSAATELPPASDTPTLSMTPIAATDASTATLTPEPPSATPTATGTFTPTPIPTLTPLPLTATPIATPAPASTSAPAPTPASAPGIPTGSFTLLKPLSVDDISYGLTEFQWEWTGDLPAGFGFEVRVWREGEFPAGAHDAVRDNQDGSIENVGGNGYRLSTDIGEAAGVQGRPGEYLWTVALVQISPEYGDLGQQAEPARLRFEGGGGGGDGGDGGGGGGGGVGIE